MRSRPHAWPASAPDALAVGEIPARATGPVHLVGGEIEPEFFRAHASVVHDLQFQRAPAREPFVVQGRGVTGQDGIAGQGLEQFQQLYVVLFLIVETVSAPRCTGVMEIGRIAVDQFAPPVVILRQEPMSTVVDLLYRIVTFAASHGERSEGW